MHLQYNLLYIDEGTLKYNLWNRAFPWRVQFLDLNFEVSALQKYIVHNFSVLRALAQVLNIYLGEIFFLLPKISFQY